MYKRLIAVILAAVMLCAASCAAGEGASANETSAAPGSDVPDTAEETKADLLEERQLVADDLPELDFNGAEFQMIVQTRHLNDAWVEELTGEMVDDEVYNRNSRVSERLNIVIKEAINTDSYGDINSMVEQSVLAGDGAYNLVLQHAVASGEQALKGHFVNWYNVPYVNFEKPWYPQESIKDLSVKGQMYITVSDMCISLTKNTYCMFFDKVVAAEYNLGNVYDIVRDGKWTLDTMIDMTKDIYKDENGNGKKDENDFFGFGTDSASNVITYIWSCDSPIVAFTEDDTVDVLYISEKTDNIVTKIKEFLANSEGAIYKNEHAYGATLFSKGRVLFANGLVGFSREKLSEYENDFGIIPYPKYDESQERYYTMVDGNFSVIAIPRGLSDEDIKMAGAVVEAMSADGWKNVVPKYFDVALKVRYARDMESVEMLDMIMSSRVVDFAYLYDNWKGFALTTQDIVNGNTDFASFTAKQLKAKTKYYEKVLQFFIDNQGN